MTSIRLVQFIGADGERSVGRVGSNDAVLDVVATHRTVAEIAAAAIASERSLAVYLDVVGTNGSVEYDEVIAEGRLLPPVDHVDPAHLMVTGTGLTHLGSADARDEMHAKVLDSAEDSLTDSMKMFRLGLEGGRPDDGSPGVQPEWFYKGNGSTLVASGQPWVMPHFALDGGEEPELAGVYLIGPDGAPWRLGYAVGNEFSDHVLEKQNYLYLAHSKLRQCSIGPELRVGSLPSNVAGRVAVNRGGSVLWESEWRSGEENMSHFVSGLEYHHFKYDLFRQPGDLHVHLFGTSVLSYASGITTMPGDEFEISAEGFGRPLRNRLERAQEAAPITINEL